MYNFSKLVLPIIIVLIFIILSMLLLSYYNIKLNGPKRGKLIRSVTYEGLDSNV